MLALIKLAMKCFALSSLVLVILLHGCVEHSAPSEPSEPTNLTTPSEPSEPTNWTVSRPPNLSDNCQQVIENHNIPAVRSCCEEAFLVDGQRIILVEIEFGGPHDCPSGCFYSHYTGVIEDGKDYHLCFHIYDAPRGASAYEPSLTPVGYNITQVYPRAYLLTEVNTSGIHPTIYSECLTDALQELFYDDEDCLLVPEGKYTQMCLEQVQYRKDREYFRSFNQYDLTVENCNEIKTLELKEFCYTVVAHKQKKPEVCDLITDTYTKHYTCLYGMYQYVHSLYSPENAVEPCKKIDPTLPYGRGSKNSFEELDGTLKDHCFYYAALAYNIPSICSDISEETLRETCYMGAR